MSLFAFKSEKFVCCSGFPEVCFQLLFLVKRLLKVHGFEWQIKGTYFWSVVKLSFLFLFYVYSVMRKEKWVKLSHINNNESVQFSSVQFSCSVMSDSLWPHGLQHTRPPCPSPTPGIYSNSCPLSRWCHPTISSSVIPFSSRLQYFPASGSFQMSQLFASGGQSIGVSASAYKTKYFFCL